MIYCEAVPGATIYKITRFYLNIEAICYYITRFTLLTEILSQR